MPFTPLYGISHYQKSNTSELTQYSTVEWLRWNFLQIGAFGTATLPTSGTAPGLHTLKPRSDPAFADRRVWEAPKGDWVWESGVNYSRQPVNVSGVWVNGAYFPATTSGVYAHTVDYKNGRVLFSNPVSGSSSVAVEHSYPLVRFYESQPWFQTLQRDVLKAVSDSQFSQFGSGNFDVLAKNRIQLPAVVVEAVAAVPQGGKPYEIGARTLHYNQPILLHVLAENEADMKRVHDILVRQKESVIGGIDKGEVARHNAFPIKPNGDKAVSGLCYPDLHAAHPWKNINVIDTSSTQQPEVPGLWISTVRWATEIIT